MRILPMRGAILIPTICTLVSLQSGCRTRDETAQALEEVLGAAHRHGRTVHIDDYIAKFLAATPRAHYLPTPCGNGESFNIRVTSPGEWDEFVTTVQARQQTWDISVDCRVGDVQGISGEILVDKTFDAFADQGTARVTGSITAERARRCEVDVVFAFETQTGEATVISGEICDRPAEEFDANWVVPGYLDEHLVGEY